MNSIVSAPINAIGLKNDVSRPGHIQPSATDTTVRSPLLPDFVPTPAHVSRRKAGKVPRPPNSWMLFRSMFYRTMRNDSSECYLQQAVSKIASVEWKNLPDSEKEIYKRQAKYERDRHAVLHPDFRYNTRSLKSKSKEGGRVHSTAPVRHRPRRKPRRLSSPALESSEGTLQPASPQTFGLSITPSPSPAAHFIELPVQSPTPVTHSAHSLVSSPPSHDGSPLSCGSQPELSWSSVDWAEILDAAQAFTGTVPNTFAEPAELYHVDNPPAFNSFGAQPSPVEGEISADFCDLLTELLGPSPIEPATDPISYDDPYSFGSMETLSPDSGRMLSWPNWN